MTEPLIFLGTILVNDYLALVTSYVIYIFHTWALFYKYFVAMKYR